MRTERSLVRWLSLQFVSGSGQLLSRNDESDSERFRQRLEVLPPSIQLQPKASHLLNPPPVVIVTRPRISITPSRNRPATSGIPAFSSTAAPRPELGQAEAEQCNVLFLYFLQNVRHGVGDLDGEDATDPSDELITSSSGATVDSQLYTSVNRRGGLMKSNNHPLQMGILLAQVKPRAPGRTGLPVGRRPVRSADMEHMSTLLPTNSTSIIFFFHSTSFSTHTPYSIPFHPSSFSNQPSSNGSATTGIPAFSSTAFPLVASSSCPSSSSVSKASSRYSGTSGAAPRSERT